MSFEPDDKKHKAVLLTTNTEVSIAPKSRPKPTAKTQQAAQAASLNGSGQEMKRSSKAAKLRILPANFFEFISRPEKRVAWVSPSSFSHLARLKIPLREGLSLDAIQVRSLKEPSDPTANESPPQANEGSVPASRVIHSAADTKDKTSEEQDLAQENLVCLRWSRLVPDGNIVFESPFYGLKDWGVW